MSIAEPIIEWQLKHGRHDLPWQHDINPYRVWVSEIMLQQTQVATVIPYYRHFMHRFPTVSDLASADEDAVLKLWSGLGYYRRAKYLHKASQIIVNDFNGVIPNHPEALESLPGIGKSTAHAILSIANNLPYAILDGNVKRVLSRVFCINEPLDNSTAMKKLWHIAQNEMPRDSCRVYSQGIMDLGSQICTQNPLCDQCPLRHCCTALKRDLQAQLPIKKKRVKKLTKEVFFVCYISNRQLFMTQRGDDGIWPQLWTPVMVETLSDSHLYSDQVIPLEPYRHIFTHLNLIIKPVIALTEPEGITGRWFDKDTALLAAIPAAVKKLILQNNLFDC